MRAGLIFPNGKEKPSFEAYRLPLWMPKEKASDGSKLEVWGSVRAAKRYPRAEVGTVNIQLNRRTVHSVDVTNPKGYFDVNVAFAHSGSVRLAWHYPGGPTVFSRDIAVTEKTASGGSTALAAVLAAVFGGVLIMVGYLLCASLAERQRRGDAEQLSEPPKPAYCRVTRTPRL